MMVQTRLFSLCKHVVTGISSWSREGRGGAEEDTEGSLLFESESRYYFISGQLLDLGFSLRTGRIEKGRT